MSFSDKIISFNNNHKIASHILFWFLLLLVQLSSSSYYNSDQVPFRNNLIGDGTNLLAQIPAAYFVAYFVVPRLVYKQKYYAAFVAFLIGSYVICVLSRIEVIYIEEPFYGRLHKPDETFIEILTDIPKLVYVYFFRIFSVAFIFMILKLLKDQQMVQKRTLWLEKEKAESELKLLKTQLNPHFLFNTLNNIYSLSLSNSPVTSASIARLSEILDYILYRCNSTFVPLSGEINLLDNYIGLEKLRYDNRLKVNFKITQQHDIQIAPLILLTIVENAFKHGAGNDAGNPEINIELYADNSQFRFTVVNSVYTKKNMNNNGNIGLSNLKQQLDLLYHGKHEIKTIHTDTLFTVSLNISLL
ncbi:sensor histidine kinase [Mucilaginibacter ginsenosidivorax]|uniref:Histidine kinase n=1 Tax=Mucilaginibacter ginsenosidivorax TaxID=862126 RepID=A0A5B8VY02_9SPHI|nr:histidine kinase [Mucilaginibacter ginsenosidivorax]QEC76223.1 histidine kinase [Mucilaginibacter ginsenosidivorax]